MVPIPFNFVSAKASNSNFPFLKMSITSVFVVSFIPHKFHVPKRLTVSQLYRTGVADISRSVRDYLIRS